ncbi:MAG: SAM-dependent methyltransferase [Syntrophobacteraceae bacterium]|nr:SAM-dependent methyltransferase [Syntrophobacteraceae bacterium]
MDNNSFSLTALGAAFMRGYHARHDDPKIFHDPLAYGLLTEKERFLIARHWLNRLQSADAEGAKMCPDEASALRRALQIWTGASVVLSRARYAEEALREGIGRGIRQYVILGAGMDTFAFRCPEAMEKVEVFEVDHPATQTFKRNRIAELGWKIPSGLHFVPLDFTESSLGEMKSHSPYNPAGLTFFSWLGVTYYLSRKTVLDTLAAVARISPPESMVVFDYLGPRVASSRIAAKRLKAIGDSLRDLGEPLKTGFDPAALGADLARSGLRLVEDLAPSDIQRRYFDGRTDGYRASEHIRFALAAVK